MLAWVTCGAVYGARPPTLSPSQAAFESIPKYFIVAMLVSRVSKVYPCHTELSAAKIAKPCFPRKRSGNGPNGETCITCMCGG